METYVFKQSVRDWMLHGLDEAIKLVMLMVVLVADSASSNLKLFRWLQCLFQHNVGVCYAVLFWFERCGCHRMCRILLDLLSDTNLSGPLFGLGKLMKFGPNRKNFRMSLRQAVANMHWQQGGCMLVPTTTSKAWRTQVESLLCTTWGLSEEPKTEHADAHMRFRRCWDFWNMDPTIGKAGHCCKRVPDGSGGMTWCHRSRAHAIADGAAISVEMVEERGQTKFLPTRWLKVVPSLVWLARLFCVCPLGRDSLS